MDKTLDACLLYDLECTVSRHGPECPVRQECCAFSAERYRQNWDGESFTEHRIAIITEQWRGLKVKILAAQVIQRSRDRCKA